jgi:hypothetical protein
MIALARGRSGSALDSVAQRRQRTVIEVFVRFGVQVVNNVGRQRFPALFENVFYLVLVRERCLENLQREVNDSDVSLGKSHWFVRPLFRIGFRAAGRPRRCLLYSIITPKFFTTKKTFLQPSIPMRKVPAREKPAPVRWKNVLQGTSPHLFHFDSIRAFRAGINRRPLHKAADCV